MQTETAKGRHPSERRARRSRSVRLASIVGRTFRSVVKINDALAVAEQHFNLVAPASSIASLPDGYGVAFTVVHVDPAVPLIGMGRDVFLVDEGLSLRRHKLDQIGAAAEIRWDVEASGRVDDAKDPHVWRYRVVGSVMSLEGRELSLPGEYELDLRDRSARVKEILAQVRANARGTSADADARARELVLQQRKHGLRRAETGARGAAITSLGFKRTYSAAEMALPFVIAKLTMLKAVGDAETRRAIAVERARLFLGGGRALYGSRFNGTAPVPAAARAPSELPADEHTLPDRARTPVRDATDEQLATHLEHIEGGLKLEAYAHDEEERFVALRDEIIEEQKRRGERGGQS
jgi:hypothetical protein